MSKMRPLQSQQSKLAVSLAPTKVPEIQKILVELLVLDYLRKMSQRYCGYYSYITPIYVDYFFQSVGCFFSKCKLPSGHEKKIQIS